MIEQTTSLLQKCHSKRTKYLDELTDLSKKLDTTGSDRVWGEIEARMSVVHTAISAVEASINTHET